jgi:signal transduction histidine kinase
VIVEGADVSEGARARAVQAARWAALVTVVLGVAVLVGWSFDIQVLKSIVPVWVTMKANTALCFVLIGAALLLLLREPPKRVTDNFAYALAALATLIGMLTVAEYVSGLDLRIDQMLFHEMTGAVQTVTPGRMAVLTAIGFVLLGLALILFRARKVWFAQAATLLTGVVFMVSFSGYLYEVIALERFGPTAIAAHTAVGFLLLVAGVLLAQAGRGVMASVTNDGADGVMLRRLLPAVLVMPYAIGGLIQVGIRQGLYGTDFGWALFSLATMLTLVAFVSWNAKDLHRLDKAHRSALDSLEDAVSELQAFSYSVSHDLRAPLRSLDGFSTALLEDYGDKLDEEGLRHLERIRGAARKMGELTDGLLALSRLSRAEPHFIDLDLSRLAEEIAGEIRKSDPSRQVEFAIQPGLHAVADVTLIRPLIQNLLDNAWKFTSRKERARIEFGAEDSGGEHVYYVRDDGAGFDMAYADKLFVAFQRLHSQGDFPGIGIGLATVARIVHRHRGRVWAEGEPDDGATFRFTLNAEEG